MPIRVVGFDGDDTLWHNETRFIVTQGELQELLRRHVPEADVHAHLAEMEMKNLGMYGYGVKAFTLYERSDDWCATGFAYCAEAQAVPRLDVATATADITGVPAGHLMIRR